MADKIRLRVVTPSRMLLDEEVDEVTAPGELGEFGVLPNHIAFLSTLVPGELSYKQGNVRHTMAISGGYPGDYEKGYTISGLDDIDTAESMLFHAGTTTKDGKVVTNGGRVLCITSYGDSIFDAVEKSKEELANISFTGMSYRRDIGYEFE